jgi:ketosteroid isomerase-like protein
MEAAILRRGDRTRPGLDQERAMAKRLAQLQAALGDDASMRTSPAPEAATMAPSSGFGLPSIMVTGMSALLLGAGISWLLLSPTGTIQAAPQAPTAIAVVKSQPTPLVEARETDKMQIEGLLENWRQAWQARDVTNYLAAYGKAFKPADGTSREAWISARTKKLTTTAAIEVELGRIALERIEQDLFRVSFQQSYASGNYRETNRSKTLLIVREDGNWKIVSEQQN